MPTQTFKQGDRVTFPPDALIKQSLRGVIFTVLEVPTGRKTKYRISPEGGTTVYGAKAEDLIPAPEGDAPIGRPYVPVTIFDPGQIVTISNGTRKNIADNEPFVVVRDTGRDTVAVTKVGGEGGRYWNWPRNGLVKRTLADLAEYLLDAETKTSE